MSSYTDQARKVSVSIDRLEVGCKTDQDVFVGTTLLLSSGTEISESILRLLKRRGISSIQVSSDSILAGEEGGNVNKAREVFGSADSILDMHGVRLTVPLPIIKDACEEIDCVFVDAVQGLIDIDKVHGALDPVITPFIQTPPDIVKLHDPAVSEYAVNHGIKVGLYYLVIARDWCRNEEELRNQISGAVLKDIGMAMIDPSIVTKPGKLSDEEWKAMCQHPVHSAKVLGDRGANEQMLSIAMCHHEKLDGTGYPYGLKADQIDSFARLAAICDVYDAITSNKTYRGRSDYAFAIDEIIRCSGSHLDAEIANRFIRRIGRFPVGSFVELSNGARAVVVRISEDAILKPVVSVVISEYGEPITERSEIDLVKHQDLHVKRALRQEDVI